MHGERPSDRTIARYLKEKLDGTVQVAYLNQDKTKVWKHAGRFKKVPQEEEIEDFIIRQVSLSDPPVDFDNCEDVVDLALKEIADRGLPAVSRDQILRDLMSSPKAIISQSIHTHSVIDQTNPGIFTSLWRNILVVKNSLSQARFSLATIILLAVSFRLFEVRKKREAFFFLTIIFLLLPPRNGSDFSGSRNESTVQSVRLKCSHQKH